MLRVALFDRLIDDATMFPPTEASAPDAVHDHREHRAAWFAGVIGPLVVPDRRLAEVGRAAGSAPIEVSVVNTGGAGGLVALAQRTVPGVDLIAVESALRDLDDLGGNAARVAAAAGELGEEVTVFVEIPYAPGWVDAVEEVEAAGLLGKITAGGIEPEHCPSPDRLAEQLSVLVEADLPFKAALGSGRARPYVDHAGGEALPQHGVLTVLLALAALIDGATARDAADLLRLEDAGAIHEAIAGWDEATATRVRRRLRSVACGAVREVIDDLESLGLVAATS